MTQEIFHNLGVWSAIVMACIALAIVQGLAFAAIGYMAKRIYQRLYRAYSLHVVWYWLNRLEKEGTHCFEKAHPTEASHD